MDYFLIADQLEGTVPADAGSSPCDVSQEHVDDALGECAYPDGRNSLRQRNSQCSVSILEVLCGLSDLQRSGDRVGEDDRWMILDFLEFRGGVRGVAGGPVRFASNIGGV